MPYMPIGRRQQLLLDAGVRVIERAGVAAATTRAVVTEAHMSLASFHYAFASHEEFLLRLIEREFVPHPLPHPTDASFPAAVEAFLSQLVADDVERHLVSAELAMHGITQDSLAEVSSRHLQAYDEQLAEGLRLLAAQYGMVWVVDPGHLASQLNAWRLGTVVQTTYARRCRSYPPPNGAADCAAMLLSCAQPAAS